MLTAETTAETYKEKETTNASSDEQQYCYHCNEVIPQNLLLYVEIENKKQPMCCLGCQAVANAIIDYGLSDFYKFRTESSIKPEQLIPEQLRHFSAYDEDVLQQGFLETEEDGVKSISLILADMTCPACVWLVESRLGAMPGVSSINVNYSSQRAKVKWNDSACQLSDILKTIAGLGYKVRPYDISQGQKQLNEEQNSQLRRIGLAGVLGMQVMMISIALYVGDWSGMENNYRVFLSWISLLLTTPVILYSAQLFFIRAWRDLRLFRTGMDVPVSLGLLIAYSNSVWATISGAGQIYYDSIVMFVFFLLAGRYFEFRARRQSSLHVDNIGQLLPSIACKIVKNNEIYEHETVAVSTLQKDDLLLICPGEIIPVDGYLIEGETTVNEALLTGESAPVFKSLSAMLIGGSTNLEQTIKMRVSKVGKDTVCSHIYKLMEQGQSIKPEMLALSHQVSAWFVFSVLIIALVTAVYWFTYNPALWVSITISVLVVSCPCALSLATPVALAAAASRLMKSGIILVNSNVIETLSKVTAFVFDKTGTLTEGQLKISKIVSLSSKSQTECLAIAKAIEINSAHPLARAFTNYSVERKNKYARKIKHYPGSGMSAEVDGCQYYLGNEKFIKQKTGIELDNVISSVKEESDSTFMLFADNTEIHCIFVLRDRIRNGAQELMDYLNTSNKTVRLLSGDNEASTSKLANYLKIDNYLAAQSPAGKMLALEKMQASGEIVAMLGDGVNDAPVLACANASIAMGDGAALANANADLILLQGNLTKLIEAIEIAAMTKKVIRQNMKWAIAYNLTALPLAITGLITPWMAAIGMSLSSLIVVINSNRINHQ